MFTEGSDNNSGWESKNRGNETHRQIDNCEKKISKRGWDSLSKSWNGQTWGLLDGIKTHHNCWDTFLNNNWVDFRRLFFIPNQLIHSMLARTVADYMLYHSVGFYSFREYSLCYFDYFLQFDR